MFQDESCVTPKAAKVLIVDDHPAVREALSLRIRTGARPGSLRPGGRPG